MPRGSIVERIPAERADVFRLVHDYDRRLEWDTLLQSAFLTEGAKAGLHAIAVCKGRFWLGGIEIESEYVSFREPDVAAVKMVNPAPFFETFAATIRHRDLGNGWSQVEYVYRFMARPAWLGWLLHPVMHAVLRWETRRRLQALRAFFVRERQGTALTIRRAGQALRAKK
jgi:Polyketide cyclase / dehydrase and lipid transport